LDYAGEQLRALLAGSADPHVILDMHMGQLANDQRKDLAEAADELRQQVARG
jgi:hypothetical protein